MRFQALEDGKPIVECTDARSNGDWAIRADPRLLLTPLSVLCDEHVIAEDRAEANAGKVDVFDSRFLDSINPYRQVGRQVHVIDCTSQANYVANE